MSSVEPSSHKYRVQDSPKTELSIATTSNDRSDIDVLPIYRRTTRSSSRKSRRTDHLPSASRIAKRPFPGLSDDEGDKPPTPEGSPYFPRSGTSNRSLSVTQLAHHILSGGSMHDGRKQQGGTKAKAKAVTKELDPNDGRCLLTGSLGSETAIEVCHLIAQADVHKDYLLEYAWGLKYRKLNLDEPRNLLHLRSDWHRLFDNERWALLPSRNVVNHISLNHKPGQDIRRLYDNQKFFEYHLLPLSPQIAEICRFDWHNKAQKLHTCYTYPFDKFPVLQSHVEPHFVIWNTGQKLATLGETRMPGIALEVGSRTPGCGEADTTYLLIALIELYQFWSGLDVPPKFKGDVHDGGKDVGGGKDGHGGGGGGGKGPSNRKRRDPPRSDHPQGSNKASKRGAGSHPAGSRNNGDARTATSPSSAGTPGTLVNVESVDGLTKSSRAREVFNKACDVASRMLQKCVLARFRDHDLKRPKGQGGTPSSLNSYLDFDTIAMRSRTVERLRQRAWMMKYDSLELDTESNKIYRRDIDTLSVCVLLIPFTQSAENTDVLAVLRIDQPDGSGESGAALTDESRTTCYLYTFTTLLVLVSRAKPHFVIRDGGPELAYKFVTRVAPILCFMLGVSRCEGVLTLESMQSFYGAWSGVPAPSGFASSSRTIRPLPPLPSRSTLSRKRRRDPDSCSGACFNSNFDWARTCCRHHKVAAVLSEVSDTESNDADFVDSKVENSLLYREDLYKDVVNWMSVCMKEFRRRGRTTSRVIKDRQLGNYNFERKRKAKTSQVPHGDPMDMRKDDLYSLLSLINKATEDAIHQYEIAGCDIPSLDAQAHLPQNDIPLRRALRLLEGACFQLCTTLSPPELIIFNRSLEPVESACLRIAINAKIADVLYDHHEGLHVREISRETSIEQGKLLKVMRNLAAKHCFREVAPDVFGNNRISLVLVHDSPMAVLTSLMMEDLNKFAVTNFYDALVDPEYGHSYDSHRTAFGYGIREEMPNATLFQWLQHHPESKERFHRGMIGMGLITDCQVVIEQLPWGDLHDGATICDVGSGIGLVMSGLAKRYPHVHLTLQDLASVVGQARSHWESEHLEFIKDKRVDFVPLDFLKDPPVKNQDIYFIRQVIHNWPDHDCVTILKHVREAMKESSRVLIHEYVMQPNAVGLRSQDENDSGVNTAPKPLLPSYGYGRSRAYLQDVNMHMLTNAGERTLDEFIELGNKAGLRFVKTWDFVETSCVEFALKT
ncbi:hypothetical protein EW146_g4400 [Bondarzewia mesenterica]|uniref:O-methyltransferase domain-containing protein n=1 Tax=Bondarzewia mesenterica TaxID=1095465 RepID=A0A4S4M0G1_9AGAM|nr:hypothetical protein EW146_g4400 [Bondarzewia mesenterica]